MQYLKDLEERGKQKAVQGFYFERFWGITWFWPVSQMAMYNAMPVPQMPMQNDMMTMMEFREQFAHGGRYGVQGELPKETILFYRLIVTNGYGWPWKKLLSHRGRHAEELMVDELQSLALQYGTYMYTLEIVLNYSPCRNCSFRLKQTKDVFQKRGNDLRITIKTSSFYKTYECFNMDSLVDLVRENIVLKIFDGEPDWMEFLRDVINLPERSISEWLVIPLTKERRAREYIDRFILKDIYDCYRGNISVEDLHEMGRDPYRVVPLRQFSD